MRGKKRKDGELGKCREHDVSPTARGYVGRVRERLSKLSYLTGHCVERRGVRGGRGRGRDNTFISMVSLTSVEFPDF